MVVAHKSVKDIPWARWQPLQYILEKEALLSKEQVALVMRKRQETSQSFVLLISQLGFVSAEDICVFLERIYNIPRFSGPLPAGSTPHLLTRPEALQHHCVPFVDPAGKAWLACVDPFHAMKVFPPDKAASLEMCLITPTYLHTLLDQLYGQAITFKGMVEQLTDLHLPHTQDPQVADFLDKVLAVAVQHNASDLHFEPTDTTVSVRWRVDGILLPVLTMDRVFWSAIITRLKVLSRLNLSECRLPQSGHFQLLLEGRPIDLRISTMPGLNGESVVLRLLDQAKTIIPLNALGFMSDQIHALQKAISKPHGLFLIAGPTGSGKTTTLYALLQTLVDKPLKILTLEDPVEYKIPGIQQIQVDEEGGLSFAEGVRSLLRHDPDVLLIGEIRDSQTAEMALRAALTGHLVLGTVHAARAWTVFDRFSELGVSPSMLGTHMVGVMAQRLVRKICFTCKGESPTACPLCHGTGYQGRLAVAELLTPTASLKAFLSAPVFEPLSEASCSGFTPFETHINWLLDQNLTTSLEITRVFGDSFLTGSRS